MPARSSLRLAPLAFSLAGSLAAASPVAVAPASQPVPAAPMLQPQPEQPDSPDSAEPDTPGASAETIPNMQFPNADVRSVLDFYEKLTGKKAIYDNTVQGRVNIFINKPVSRQEAIRVIETALLVNGFTLVPGPGDIVKVLGNTKNPRQFAVPIVSDVGEIPRNDQIISFLFQLRYADPLEVQQLISQYVSPSPYSSFLALPKSQAILVTESSSVIRRLSQVIEAIDHPPAEVVSEFIPLQRADAKDVVEKLTALFEKRPNRTDVATPGSPGALADHRRGGPRHDGEEESANPPAASVLAEDSLIVGKIRLTADLRTNRIHVVTRPVNLPFIRRLIGEYDSDISFGEPAKRTLRFVAAGDVLDVVVRAIAEPGMKIEESGGGSGQSTSGNSNTANATPAYANNASGTNPAGPQLGGEELSTPDVETTPESRTVGNTKIIADRRSNAIIVLGNQEAKNKIMKVLDEIDVRAPQVMLTAVIGELTLNNDEEFGVDYLQHLGGGSVTDASRSGFAGVTRNTSTPLADLGTLTSAASLAGATNGVTAFIGITRSMEAIVHALESTGRFHITSRPMIFTSNNKKALIASGQEIPVPGTTLSGFTGGTGNSLVNNTSIEYRDVVLKLEVQPLINSENEVTLDIVQEVNSVGNSTVIAGNSIPTINARRIKTTVSVANQSTVVLGGLVQETRENSRSRIPVLGKIPLIGSLFGNKTKSLKRTELIVLLRPTVTNGPAEAVRAGKRAQEKLQLPPDLDATLDATVRPVRVGGKVIPRAQPVRPIRQAQPVRPTQPARPALAPPRAELRPDD